MSDELNRRNFIEDSGRLAARKAPSTASAAIVATPCSFYGTAGCLP